METTVVTEMLKELRQVHAAEIRKLITYIHWRIVTVSYQKMMFIHFKS